MWMFKLLPKEILNAKKTYGITEEKKSILIFFRVQRDPRGPGLEGSGLHLEQKEEKHKHKHDLEDPKTKKHQKETQM